MESKRPKPTKPVEDNFIEESQLSPKKRASLANQRITEESNPHVLKPLQDRGSKDPNR